MYVFNWFNYYDQNTVHSKNIRFVSRQIKDKRAISFLSVVPATRTKYFDRKSQRKCSWIISCHDVPCKQQYCCSWKIQNLSCFAHCFHFAYWKVEEVRSNDKKKRESSSSLNVKTAKQNWQLLKSGWARPPVEEWVSPIQRTDPSSVSLEWLIKSLIGGGLKSGNKF